MPEGGDGMEIVPPARDGGGGGGGGGGAILGPRSRCSLKFFV